VLTDDAVLVLLLRLRQICSHPALIQEGETALVTPDEMDESIATEIRDELSRARNLVGSEFVAKMKFKLKETALRRIEAEKASVDAEVEDEEASMCC
jgi:SNF2 family DNA or RNA helicase